MRHHFFLQIYKVGGGAPATWASMARRHCSYSYVNVQEIFVSYHYRHSRSKKYISALFSNCIKNCDFLTQEAKNLQFILFIFCFFQRGCNFLLGLWKKLQFAHKDIFVLPTCKISKRWRHEQATIVGDLYRPPQEG